MMQPSSPNGDLAPQPGLCAGAARDLSRGAGRLRGVVHARPDTGIVHGAGLDLGAEWTDHDADTPRMDHRPQRRHAGIDRPDTGARRTGPQTGTDNKRPVTGHNDTMGQMWDHPTLGRALGTGARKTLRPRAGHGSDGRRASRRCLHRRPLRMTIRRTTRSLALSAFVAPVLMMSATHGAAASLSENKTINDGLFAIAAADEIRKTCPSIDARMLKALGFLNSLESHARQQGYSKREIDDFVDSKADKKRLEKRAADYLAAKGAVSARPETYCTVGRAEIAANSQIGALLKAK